MAIHVKTRNSYRGWWRQLNTAYKLIRPTLAFLHHSNRLHIRIFNLWKFTNHDVRIRKWNETSRSQKTTELHDKHANSSLKFSRSITVQNVSEKKSTRNCWKCYTVAFFNSDGLRNWSERDAETERKRIKSHFCSCVFSPFLQIWHLILYCIYISLSTVRFQLISYDLVYSDRWTVCMAQCALNDW